MSDFAHYFILMDLVVFAFIISAPDMISLARQYKLVENPSDPAIFVHLNEHVERETRRDGRVEVWADYVKDEDGKRRHAFCVRRKHVETRDKLRKIVAPYAREAELELWKGAY
jgi:hypothetical protein